MKISIKINIILAILVCLISSSCQDFLDRPSEDNYNIDNFFTSDAQCYQAVNPIYNSPWSDFQRFYFKAGEVFSGNLYGGSTDPYQTYTVNASDQYLGLASAALWSVNAYCSSVISSVDGAKASTTTKLTCKGECLVWKAMAYFFLVRTFGAVPIVHNPADIIAKGGYSTLPKAEVSDVYDYIVMTLKQAIEWLPENNPGGKGRIDKYSAEGLLAKVYLTKSGWGSKDGQRNEEDLNNAAKYAKDVIDNSGRNLLPVYSDLFRLENNVNEESLIAWRWTADPSNWTSQNMLQSDLAMGGFDEFGDCWGDWTAPTIDLQEAFGDNALDLNRNNTDARRKATMMMAGDKYDYFYKDCGGFDYLKFIYKGYENHVGAGIINSPTGANVVKHLYGDAYDHVQGSGISASSMHSSVATHLLRLADVYLIYAEAVIGNNTSTSDAGAIDAFYKVRHRSVISYERPSSITWEEVWKERRLELALECDHWFDFVRLHYYKPELAKEELKKINRSTYVGLDPYYKTFYETGSSTLDPTTTWMEKSTTIVNINDNIFTLPFPDTDLSVNPNLSSKVKPVHVDISQYHY